MNPDMVTGATSAVFRENPVASPTETDYGAIIHETLAPLIPRGAPLALVDFPNHSNVGDSAIWLGEEQYLRTYLPQSRIIWTADTDTVFMRPLPALPPECVILIHGGGNFGDLWPTHQNLRETLLRLFRNNRVIQLPQSIYFRDPAKAEPARHIFSQHRDFHLLVRDRTSFDTARNLYHCPVYLCPDMALMLGRWPRRVEPTCDIFALIRTDRERAISTDASTVQPSPVVEDWVDEPVSLTNRADRQIRKLESLYPNHITSPQWFRRFFYQKLATERMNRGCDQLARGRIVITDRLHAHILCTLMRIPHVVLDNSYGKISNFRLAWRTGPEICRSSDTFNEGAAVARMMLDDMTSKSSSALASAFR